MIALYARTSSEEQKDRATIQNQVQYGNQYAALHQINFAQTFLDDGVSGTIPLEKRPAGAALLNAAKSGQVSTVYVYKLDRLGRGVRVIFNALHQLEEAGCSLVSMTETFENVSPAGKAMFGMLSVFAAFERDSMQARIRDGYDAKAQLYAKYMGGPRPPYGYQVQGVAAEAIIVEHPEESAIIRLIYDLAVRSRLSSREIADHLNSLGVPTATAGRILSHWKTGRTPSGLWHPAYVGRILRNPTYRGVRTFNKRSKTERPRRTQLCPPLIDDETWAAAQTHLDALRLPKLRPGHRVYILRGLLTCSLCSKHFHGWPRSDIHHYYICHGNKYPPKCGNRLLRADVTEAAVWGQIEARIAQLRRVAVQDDEGEQAAEIEEQWRREECGRVQAGLASKSEERQRLLSLYRRGRIDDTDLDRQLADVDREQAELTERWAGLQNPVVKPRLDLRALLDEIDAALVSATPEARQRVAGLLIARILVYPKGTVEALGLEWR